MGYCFNQHLIGLPVVLDEDGNVLLEIIFFFQQTVVRLQNSVNTVEAFRRWRCENILLSCRRTINTWTRTRWKTVKSLRGPRSSVRVTGLRTRTQIRRRWFYGDCSTWGRFKSWSSSWAAVKRCRNRPLMIWLRCHISVIYIYIKKNLIAAPYWANDWRREWKHLPQCYQCLFWTRLWI